MQGKRVLITGSSGLIGGEVARFFAKENATTHGIDNNLRKTFRNALFTGFGVIAFIVGSELMEAFVGYGMAGGVIVGISLITIRNPILGILDSVSGRFIPSTHTPEEAAYLDAYTTAMEDQIITPEERKLLDTVAATYGLNAKIIKQLESEYEARLLNPYTAAERGSVDIVIHPEDTRKEVSAALDFLLSKREKLEKRLHSNTPL